MVIEVSDTGYRRQPHGIHIGVGNESSVTIVERQDVSIPLALGNRPTAVGFAPITWRFA